MSLPLLDYERYDFCLAVRLCSLLGLFALIKHPAMLERPMWQRTEGGIWPTDSEEPKASVQQPSRNWILPTTIWVLKQIFPSWAFRWGSSCSWHLVGGPVRDSDQRTHSAMPRFLTHRNWDNTVGPQTTQAWTVQVHLKDFLQNYKCIFSSLGREN